MLHILNGVVLMYQFYFDLIFLFFSSEWYLNVVTVPYSNFFDLYYYLLGWKDYDSNVLEIIDEMDTYAFSQIGYISLEYISFYYQNYFAAPKYMLRAYTYQDYLNYYTKVVYDEVERYVSHLLV